MIAHMKNLTKFVMLNLLLLSFAETAIAEEFEPMMETLTNDGSVKVHIAWAPETIEPDIPVEFKIRLLDPSTGQPIKDAIFNFMLIHEGTHITHRSLQKATDGSSTQSFTFKSTQTGSVILRLENVNNTGESVEFSINVVPEFPASLVAALMAITFTTAIFAARKYKPLIVRR